MKQFYLAILCLLSFRPFSQPSTLYFSYDASGSQIMRNTVCVNCRTATADAVAIASKAEPDAFTASPNPVDGLLQVRWVRDVANPLQQLQLHSVTGQLLLTQPVRSAKEQLQLNFSGYLPDLSFLTGVSANGSVNIIKIIRH
ncbi:MAG: hypothetical protein QM664_00150 [Flavihumibacter sp.]